MPINLHPHNSPYFLLSLYTDIEFSQKLLRASLEHFALQLSQHKKNSRLWQKYSPSGREMYCDKRMMLYGKLQAMLMAIQRYGSELGLNDEDIDHVTREYATNYRNKLTKYNIQPNEGLIARIYKPHIDAILSLQDSYSTIRKNFMMFNVLGPTELAMGLYDLTERIKLLKAPLIARGDLGRQYMLKRLTLLLRVLVTINNQYQGPGAYPRWLYDQLLSLKIRIGASEVHAFPELLSFNMPARKVGATIQSFMGELDWNFIAAMVAAYGNSIQASSVDEAQKLLRPTTIWLLDYLSARGVSLGVGYAEQWAPTNRFCAVDSPIKTYRFLLCMDAKDPKKVISPNEESIFDFVQCQLERKNRVKKIEFTMEQAILQDNLKTTYTRIFAQQDILYGMTKPTFFDRATAWLSYFLPHVGVECKQKVRAYTITKNAYHKNITELLKLLNTRVHDLLNKINHRVPLNKSSDMSVFQLENLLEIMPKLISGFNLKNRDPELYNRYTELMLKPDKLWDMLRSDDKTVKQRRYDLMVAASKQQMHHMRENERNGFLRFMQKAIAHLFVAKQTPNQDEQPVTLGRLIKSVEYHQYFAIFRRILPIGSHKEIVMDQLLWLMRDLEENIKSKEEDGVKPIRRKSLEFLLQARHEKQARSKINLEQKDIAIRRRFQGILNIFTTKWHMLTFSSKQAKKLQRDITWLFSLVMLKQKLHEPKPLPPKQQKSHPVSHTISNSRSLLPRNESRPHLFQLLFARAKRTKKISPLQSVTAHP